MSGLLSQFTSSASEDAVVVDPGSMANACFHAAEAAPQSLNDVRKEIKDRLHELDRKEQEILVERLELKFRWNRSLLATQLPNEILIMIFVYSSAGQLLPSTDGHDGDYFKLAPARTQWAKLMLICRHWCDVMRTTPALWRTIEVGKNKAWMQLALTRSNGAIADVSFSSDFDEEDAAILEPHYHRLRSLRLRCWSPAALRVIPIANLLLLESLEITDYPEDRIIRDKNWAITYRGFTHERFPNLRTLRVSHSDIPSDPLFYTRLRNLSLKGCFIQSSLEHFVQLLSDSPSLRHLELDDFLQQLSDGENFAGPPQVLPSLRSLRLGDHLPIYSARFLARIVIPAASLSITANEEDLADATLCSIVPPNLRSSLPQLTSVTHARLQATRDDYAIECHPTAPEPGETPLITLRLTSSSGSLDQDGQLTSGIADFIALFGSTPLTHLRAWGFCELNPAGSEAWTRFFRTVRSLVSLEVDTHDMAVQSLFEASLASPADGPLVCAGLECIILEDQSRCLPVDLVTFVFDPLVRCLLYRAERGARLKELRLELHDWEIRIAVMENYLSQLEDLVSNVVFGND